MDVCSYVSFGVVSSHCCYMFVIVVIIFVNFRSGVAVD